MANWSNEAEAREQIKALVAEYYHDFKEKKADFKPGDRVTYASRVFDEKEMCALTDATLDFWLTTGRFADEFEKEFAKWIGVKFANLVNSGSSANLIAFMALTGQAQCLLCIQRRQPAVCLCLPQRLGLCFFQQDFRVVSQHSHHDLLAVR